MSSRYALKKKPAFAYRITWMQFCPCVNQMMLRQQCFSDNVRVHRVINAFVCCVVARLSLGHGQRRIVNHFKDLGSRSVDRADAQMRHALVGGVVVLDAVVQKRALFRAQAHQVLIFAALRPTPHQRALGQPVEPLNVIGRHKSDRVGVVERAHFPPLVGRLFEQHHNVVANHRKLAWRARRPVKENEGERLGVRGERFAQRAKVEALNEPPLARLRLRHVVDKLDVPIARRLRHKQLVAVCLCSSARHKIAFAALCRVLFVARWCRTQPPQRALIARQLGAVGPHRGGGTRWRV